MLFRSFQDVLEPGQWHLPYVREDDWPNTPGEPDDVPDMLKLSVACCASVSYNTVDGLVMTLDRATKLYDKLVGSTPMHASPLEHQAKVPGRAQDYHSNLGGNLGAGWVQLRKTIPGEAL